MLMIGTKREGKIKVRSITTGSLLPVSSSSNDLNLPLRLIPFECGTENTTAAARFDTPSHWL